MVTGILGGGVVLIYICIYNIIIYNHIYHKDTSNSQKQIYNVQNIGWDPRLQKYVCLAKLLSFTKLNYPIVQSCWKKTLQTPPFIYFEVIPFMEEILPPGM